MAIDGTWQRECRIGDVSDTGAKLTIRGSVDGIDTEEFFLVLSATGNAHRRCERIWLNGDEIGVRFLKERPAGTSWNGQMRGSGPFQRADHLGLALRPASPAGREAPGAVLESVVFVIFASSRAAYDSHRQRPDLRL